MGRRIDWPVVTLAVIFAVVVAIFGQYLDHRRQLSDHRQATTNATQQALDAQQARLNAEFNATRQAQCFIFTRLAVPKDPDVRRALRHALVKARCDVVIRRAHHPHRTATHENPASIDGVPSESSTTTPVSPQPRVRITTGPIPRHRPKPTPSCMVLMVPLRQCPTLRPVPLPTLPSAVPTLNLHR